MSDTTRVPSPPSLLVGLAVASPLPDDTLSAPVSPVSPSGWGLFDTTSNDWGEGWTVE